MYLGDGRYPCPEPIGVLSGSITGQITAIYVLSGQNAARVQLKQHGPPPDPASPADASVVSAGPHCGHFTHFLDILSEVPRHYVGLSTPGQRPVNVVTSV